MGAYAGARQTTDNLIFAYDSGNQFFSYPGPPVSNVIGDTSLTGGNWAKNYCTSINLDAEGRKPPGVKKNVVSWLNDGTVGGAHPTSAAFWYNYNDDTPQADNTTYTISLWVKTSGQDIQARAYTADNSETGRQNTEDITVPGDGKWHRCEWNSITTPNPTDSDSLSFRFYNSLYVPENQRVYMCAPQMTPTSYHIPFVDGSLTSTTSIKDWAGNLSITRSGTITDNSDLTFEFGAPANAAHLQVEDPSYPSAWTDAFSFEVWHYVPSGADWEDESSFGTESDATATAIIARGSYTGSIGLGRSDTQSFRHVVRTDSELSSAIAAGLSFDTWYHIVGTWDGSTNRLYINGVLEDSDTVVVSGTPDSGILKVGGNHAFGGNNGGYAQGKTPIARMYSKKLEINEIKRNFNAQRSRFGV